MNLFPAQLTSAPLSTIFFAEPGLNLKASVLTFQVGFILYFSNKRRSRGTPSRAPYSYIDSDESLRLPSKAVRAGMSIRKGS